MSRGERPKTSPWRSPQPLRVSRGLRTFAGGHGEKRPVSRVCQPHVGATRVAPWRRLRNRTASDHITDSEISEGRSGAPRKGGRPTVLGFDNPGIRSNLSGGAGSFVSMDSEPPPKRSRPARTRPFRNALQGWAPMSGPRRRVSLSGRMAGQERRHEARQGADTGDGAEDGAALGRGDDLDGRHVVEGDGDRGAAEGQRDQHEPWTGRVDERERLHRAPRRTEHAP